jgi:hypothetical protein
VCLSESKVFDGVGPFLDLYLYESRKALPRHPGEIANLTWSLVLNAAGGIGMIIELRDDAAKEGSGRSIPIRPDLRAALSRLGGS